MKIWKYIVIFLAVATTGILIFKPSKDYIGPRELTLEEQEKRKIAQMVDILHSLTFHVCYKEAPIIENNKFIPNLLTSLPIRGDYFYEFSRNEKEILYTYNGERITMEKLAQWDPVFSINILGRINTNKLDYRPVRLAWQLKNALKKQGAISKIMRYYETAYLGQYDTRPNLEGVFRKAQRRWGNEHSVTRFPGQTMVKKISTSSGFSNRKNRTTTSAPSRFSNRNSQTTKFQKNTKLKQNMGSQKISPKRWKHKRNHVNVAEVKVGPKKNLPLKSLRVIVKIEGLRARTIVDQVFFNPHSRNLEGTFYYQLPDNASLSYFAFSPSLRSNHSKAHIPHMPQAQAHLAYQMPVSKIIQGETTKFQPPKEAHVVPRQKARAAYEEVTRANVDPALVEWAGGNVFSAQVFPLRAQNYQRIVLAYEQTLPKDNNQCHYQFIPPKQGIKFDFLLVSAKANTKNDQLSTGKLTQKNKDWHAYRHSTTELHLVEDIHYSFEVPDHEFITCLQKDAIGAKYLYGRLSPDFPKTIAYGAAKAVFLLDTSFSQKVTEFDTCVQLLTKILEQNKEIKQFNILLFNVEAYWLQSRWIQNSKYQRQRILKKLDNMLLEGATDLHRALLKLTTTPWIQGENMDVFLLSNGQHTWSNLSSHQIVKDLKDRLNFTANFYCYNLGQGNSELFRELQSFKGNTFTYTQDIKQLAQAHKQEVFTIRGIYSEGLQDLIFAGNPSVLYPQQHLLFAAKIVADNPKIFISGTFQGIYKKLVFHVTPQVEGRLASRAFGELAIKKMESLSNPSLTPAIVSFSRYFSIPGKTSSLLMLETPQDYQRFKIDLSKDRTLVYYAPVKTIIKPFFKRSSKKNAFALWQKLQQHISLLNLQDQTHINKVLHYLSKQKTKVRYENNIICKQRYVFDVSKYYLKNRHKAEPYFYTQEAEKRYHSGYPGDFIRCLSSLVEQKPSNTATLRIVGNALWQKGLSQDAINPLLKILDQRAFEPQTYMDLAKCYLDLKNYNVAALLYEIVLAGKWHQRFGKLQKLARWEYQQMLHKAYKESHLVFFKQRLYELSKGQPLQADIVITVSWNTDNTDVDLWVKEPTGEECGYNKTTTSLGSRFLHDVTQGFGPERYILKNASNGEYTVKLHYFASNRNKLGNHTFAKIVITTRAGYDNEKSYRFSTWLLANKQEKIITTFNWPFASKSK